MVIPSLRELRSHIVQSEQLGSIEIVININQILSVVTQKYLQSTASEQHNCYFLIKKKAQVIISSVHQILN